MRTLLSLFSTLLIIGFSGAATAQLPDFTPLVKNQGPSVVNISTRGTVTAQAPQMPPGFPFPDIPKDDPFYEFFRRFFPPQPDAPREFNTQSLGSGFIMSANGYILTNAHVVQRADEITVKLTDGREFNAKPIGADERTDVALLKIDATGLPAVKTGNSADLEVGEWVVAIGSPFGLENSVTAGIVSAKSRILQEALVPFIQTDVAVNPGNSGGPLFNMKGEVVGINSMIFSGTGGYMGLSFAIPIDLAMNVSEQLRTTGKVTRGWLGVTVQPVTKQLAESFDLPSDEGALIASVQEGSPADKAGLQAGDVILSVDGKPLTDSASLSRHIAGMQPGARAVLGIVRDGAQRKLTVTVGELPATRVQGQPQPRQKPDAMKPNRLGLKLSDLTTEARAQNEGCGVMVEDAQGPAARAGIQRGDVILAVNNTDVKSVVEFNRIIGKLSAKRNAALLVKRGEQATYVPVEVPDS
jgi:serine protease Do